MLISFTGLACERALKTGARWAGDAEASLRMAAAGAAVECALAGDGLAAESSTDADDGTCVVSASEFALVNLSRILA